MMKKTPRPDDTRGRGESGTEPDSGSASDERRAGRNGAFLSCLYECVVCRVCHLYEHYGNLRNKATDKQNTGTDGENRNEQLDSAEHENTFIERENKTVILSSYQTERTLSR